MSVRELVPKHLFAPAEARGDSDNAFGTQKAAIAYADAEITIRVTSSYYGFLYVEHGGQCAGTRACQFHVFINGANNVVVNTVKGLKGIKWARNLLKVTGYVPFQTTPVNASGQPKVARRSRSTTARRRRPASEESASEESDSEESDSDGDSDEIERLKQELAEQKKKYAEQKKKYRNVKEKLDKQKKEFEKTLNNELDKQKKEFEKTLKEKLDKQKEELKEKVREGYEVLQVKLKKCVDKKSDQSDLALENEQLRQKIRKLMTVFHRLKDKVDSTVKRM